MKRFVVILSLFFAVVAGSLAQGLDDEYVQIFRMIQEADSLSGTAPGQALAKYLDAQTALDRLHKGTPDWNTRIVNYRLSYLAERIAALSAKGATPPPSQEGTSQAPSPVAPSPSSAGDAQARLQGLQQRVGQLQSEKTLLEAKLKEALAMRPAASDPAELAKAQDKIKILEKENELLKANAEKQTQRVPDSQSLETVNRQLAEATRQLKEQTSRLSQIGLEKEALEAKLKSSSADNGAVTSLRSENQLLKKQLADLQAAPKSAENGQQRNAAAPAQLAMLQSDNEALRLEKMALENRIKQLSVSSGKGGEASVATAESARLKQLESERASLQKQLDAAVKEKSGRKGKVAASRVQELENELVTARTRLEIFEARAVPYSPEELALLKHPETKVTEADPNSGKKSLRELPPGSAALVAEAQRCFAAREYDKAEAAYLQVLRQDPKNVPTLANLAAIQVEDRHLDQAEINVKKALTLAPEDDYSLYVLGLLKLAQSKYDDAIDAFGQAAKLDPQNAEVQNYLGLALSERGMRMPAEAALRKAVQLKPEYAGAHYNLAVVYATEKPPATELARWHYQKALASGFPRNPDLEKKFESQQ